MRKYHRWIATVGMLLLAYVAITGTILAFDELLDPQSFAAPAGPGPRAPAPPRPLPAAQLEAMTTSALRAAAASGPEVTSVHLQLRMEGDRPVATIRTDGPGASVARLDALSGAPVPRTGGNGPERRGPPSLNAFLQELHGGGILGKTGEWLALLTGVGFVTLSVTGIVLYLQMYRARRRIGRRRWFWS